MKTPIAIYNLWHQGAKTFVSIAGVAFALLLVFMQLGFMGAVSHTATNVLEQLEFDILLRPKDYLHLYESGTFERRWLEVAGNTEGVQSARPFWVMIQNWRKLPNREQCVESASTDHPNTRSREAGDFESQYLPIAVMAFEPDIGLFKLEKVNQFLRTLNGNNALLLDDSTKPDYGPWNGRFFSQTDVAQSVDPGYPHRHPEIGGVEFEIAGLFELGTGLAANAAAIMGSEAFARISPWDVRTTTCLGLVKLEETQRDEIDRVQHALRQRLSATPPTVESTEIARGESRSVFGAGAPKVGPSNRDGQGQIPTTVTVLSREEALNAEQFRWLWETPIGLIFQMGVVISLLVGAAIVYMILSTDVANRLPEYATLLAMGYSRRYLAGMVMTQAVVLCVLGFCAAWIAGELLYRLTTWFAGIPLNMTVSTLFLVGILGLLMCCCSGLLALRKLWKAEPANLF